MDFSVRRAVQQKLLPPTPDIVHTGRDARKWVRHGVAGGSDVTASRSALSVPLAGVGAGLGGVPAELGIDV